jgi:hypothetical protein
VLVSSIALGIVAGSALGGRISRLATLRIRWWPLLVAALAVRILAPLAGDFAAALYLTAFAGVVLVAVADRSLPGMPLIALGSLLNLTVVAANGGMPVDPTAAAAVGASIPNDRLHQPLTHATRLPLLADVIPLPLLRSVYSPGDVVISIGGFVLPFSWLRRP